MKIGIPKAQLNLHERINILDQFPASRCARPAHPQDQANKYMQKQTWTDLWSYTKKSWYIMCMHLYTYYLYYICSCVIYKYSQYSNIYTEIDKHLYSLSWIIRHLSLSCILHPWCQSCPLTVRHLYATSLTPVIGVTWPRSEFEWSQRLCFFVHGSDRNDR